MLTSHLQVVHGGVSVVEGGHFFLLNGFLQQFLLIRCGSGDRTFDEIGSLGQVEQVLGAVSS